ncbi:hypothetical protein [Scytonema sp. PCC 10023]|uniref:hypothetical protein n=1 Tax=Scytonema sp. PCC 10023 TaxID=1680591 RepID=UPI0039C5C44D
MIGRQKTYSVQLTEDEKRLLQQQASLPKGGASLTPAKQVKALALRAKIILTVAENPDWTDALIRTNYRLFTRPRA